MTFNSYIFAVFFLVVLAFWKLPLPWGAKKLGVVLFSYAFYASWNPPFIVLLWISTLTDYTMGRLMGGSKSRIFRKACLLVSLGVDLGLLFFFKYGHFVSENLAGLLHTFGLTVHVLPSNVILPVGISFYTFQSLSYVVDVYRNEIKACPSLLNYCFYVSFFPQLVAGPIVRSSVLLPQCEAPRRATPRMFWFGISLVVLGLFEKVVLADAILGPIVEKVYDGGGAWSSLSSLTATLAFTFQIFCDFAGYSNCAIGIALCLGFELPTNFRFPYAAASFSDFWQRWHISLSSWLRDYLYIPLGGSRSGKLLTLRNLVITMFLGGLWHGAAWAFVVWGLLHGAFLVVERILWSIPRVQRFTDTAVGEVISAGITFCGVVFAWVFFRSNGLNQAFRILGSIFGMSSPGADSRLVPHEILGVLVVSVVILSLHWAMRKRTLEGVAAAAPPWMLGAVVGVMLLVLCSVSGQKYAFVYFQF